MKRISDIAKQFKVNEQAVRNWLRDGLRYSIESTEHYKNYVAISTESVIAYQTEKMKALS